MEFRTTQDLLAERRYNSLEAHRAIDPQAVAMLEQHIATIDVELNARRRSDDCIARLGAK